MIFSGIHMLIRMSKENPIEYVEAGMGFLMMGTIETILWFAMILIIVKAN